MNKFISGIILICVGIALVFTLARPKYAEYKTVSEEVAIYDRALDQANQLNELQTSLMEKYRQIPEEQRLRLEKLLPRNIDTVRLTIEIDSIANQNGVDISSLSFASSEDDENATDSFTEVPPAEIPLSEQLAINQSMNYSSVDMSFSATGTYAELNSFIEDLEQNLRLTDIMSLSIENKEDEMTYNLVIRTYWLGT